MKLASDMAGEGGFFTHQKTEAFNYMLGLKLGKRRKSDPTLKCVCPAVDLCVFIKL